MLRSVPPEIKLVVKGVWHSDEIEAEVINPEECGSGCGRPYLLWVEDCYSPPLYVVYAGDESEAIDIFINSPRGEIERIDPETCGDDYGWECSPGDIIGGKEITEKGWMTVSGKFITDPAVGRYLQDPQMTDDGKLYDDDNIRIQILKGCRYFGHLLPAEGVPCEEYEKFYGELTERFERAERFAEFLNKRAKQREKDHGQDLCSSGTG